MNSNFVGIIGLIGTALLIVLFILAIGTKSRRWSTQTSVNAEPRPNNAAPPIIGSYILATRYGNDDTLEADANHYYFTHDTGGDLCVWKFKKPNAVTEAQIIEAFNETTGFMGWIEHNGGKPQITGWW